MRNLGLVHGNQLILPSVIKDGEPLPFGSELIVAFGEMLDRKREDEEWLSFSRLLWPIVFIQGEASNHLVIDDLGIAKLQVQVTNPPRTAKVGHILRDNSLRNEEKLEAVYKTLTYTDEVLERAPEDMEKLSVEIPGLMSPEMIQGLAKIVRDMKSSPIDLSAVLDSTFTTEQALNLSGEYRKILDLTRGNGVRWASVEQL
ncbi:MAG: hypothetical protein ACTSU5_03515, partial [Promethearchaeota archaeon]